MSQAFVKGRRVPVTKITVGSCVVTQIKSIEKDGYWSVQLGIGQKNLKNVNKPTKGHLKGAIKDTKKAPRFLAEVRLSEKPDYKVGDTVTASDIFAKGDFVSVRGRSKGKGFAGVVKRWGFAGGPRTHGQSDRERAPGSIGQRTTPGRVYKGKKMAGRMGNENLTIKNLQVISLNPDTNEIELSGPVPGVPGGLLIINRLSRGKLEGITEVAAQIVEGEEPEEEEKGEGNQKQDEKPQEGTQEKEQEDDKN